MMFTGKKEQLEKYQKEHWFSSYILPEVKAVNFLGYARELGGWVFQNPGALHYLCIARPA